MIFEFAVFCVMFGTFMLRAYMFDWKSIVSDTDPFVDVHTTTFMLFSIIWFICVLACMISRADVRRRLAEEYGGVYVTSTEFCASVPPAKLGEARFSEKFKCEMDAN